jgi:glycosyltransferase involved in cell wall biosynthesis
LKVRIQNQESATYDTLEEAIEAALEGARAVEFIGEIADSEKAEFLGNALALLFPIDWPEPFGLVMIEALAAGTPVIAWRNGSVPEVIRDGVSGVIVESMEDAVPAAENIGSFSRGAVRREFEARFTAARMARDYVTVYRRLLSHQKIALPSAAEQAA